MEKVKQAHTPGPWSIEDEGNGSLSILGGESPYKQQFVADAVYTKADAALIAAAPELLEALKVLVRRYDFQDADQQQAEKAIAKAEGR